MAAVCASNYMENNHSQIAMNYIAGQALYLTMSPQISCMIFPSMKISKSTCIYVSGGALYASLTSAATPCKLPMTPSISVIGSL